MPLLYSCSSCGTLFTRTGQSTRCTACGPGWPVQYQNQMPSGWGKIRKEWLRGHPYCADPYDTHHGPRPPATTVDHIVPRAHGGAEDASNYQSLCRRCANKKNALDVAEGKRRARER